MEKKKVMFLFGAGTEVCLGMPQGYEYLRDSLFGNENKEEILDSLSEYFGTKNYFGNYRYSKHIYSNAKAILKNLVKEKIANEAGWLETWKDKVALILNKDEINELKEDPSLAQIIDRIKLEHTKDDNGEISSIETNLKSILCQRQKYNEISIPLLKSIFVSDKNGNAVVDLNIGISGMLDGYFHTIISPEKYGKNKYAIVFNYYWMCYFCIVNAIVKNAGVEKFSEFVTEGHLNYRKVLDDFYGFTKELYDRGISNCKTDNYYSVLKEKFGDTNYQISCVATTNYFRFCELIGAKEYLYLNGQLKYLELPEILEVRDVLSEEVNNSKMFFPFVFGQSLIKPIVHPVQMKSYCDFSEKLGSADCLVVLGYNINEDDNHINSVLHDAINKGLKVVIVGEKDDELGQRESAEKLRTGSEKIMYCKVKYGNNVQVADRIVSYLERELGDGKCPD